jgi:hypothetical protein
MHKQLFKLKIIKAIIAISCCLCGFCATAQDKKQISADSTALANSATYYVDSSFSGSNISSYAYPFDSVIFHDVRYDTTTIGVTNKIAFLLDKNRFKCVTFSTGLASFLNTLLNTVKQPGNHNTKLICYIKKFRITELDSTFEYNTKKSRQVQIKAALDAFYFHSNNLYPAFRVDTTFSQLLSENKNTYSIVDSLLMSFCAKALHIDTARIIKRKIYTQENIDSMYRQRFAMPILKTTIFKRGVYTSKEEFFNNAPSITEYEWKPGKKVNILYTTDENNQWNVTRKSIFGFCDGTYIWLRVEESFYPAFRRENSFEFIAPLLLKRLVNNKSSTTPMTIGKYTYYVSTASPYSSMYYRDKSIYQIDMETGGFY